MSWDPRDDLPEEQHPIEGHECVYEQARCITCAEPEARNG